MAKPKIGVIVGSTRKGSLNRKLANAFMKLGADKAEFHDLKIDDLPVYNQDLEADNPPAAMKRFKDEAVGMDAFLFVTPEYNRNIPPLLVNAIAWGSRPYGYNIWNDKPVAISGTSPGGIATATAQEHLRHLLGSFNASHVMGGESYVQFKDGMIEDDGTVTNADTAKFLQGYIDKFIGFAGKLAA